MINDACGLIMNFSGAGDIVRSTDPPPAGRGDHTAVHETLAAGHVSGRPERLIGDKAYDSDPLDAELDEQEIELTSPHRQGRKKPETQDGRKLRRYQRC